MLNPIFSRRHRIPGAYDIPRTPTNTERVQAYRAVAPVQFYNNVFNGGGVLGVNVVERAPANNHEARWPASTLSPLKDEQPRRAASPTRP
jgi:hypothetical protein